MTVAHDKMSPLLLESAPLAYREAKRLCRGCDWYHGLWQYLRILGAVLPPSRQNDFYHSAITPLAQSGKYPRVCISGSADYGMLDVLLAIWQPFGGVPEITVVDHCQTPLFLNQWYADRVGVKINTVCEDMTAYRCESGFDVICTHSFFGNFDLTQREALIKNWHSLLRTGGKIVTANRIRPVVFQRLGFSEQQTADFIETVLRARQDMPERVLPESELAEAARSYGRNYGTYPVTSTAYIDDLFCRHGFAFDLFEVTGRQQKMSGPPSTPGKAIRLKVVATKL